MTWPSKPTKRTCLRAFGLLVAFAYAALSILWKIVIKTLRIIGVCTHRGIVPKTTDRPGGRYPPQVGVHHLPKQASSYGSGRVYVHRGDRHLRRVYVS
ncbi:hypothetical protein EDD22DRAFT_919617 [Suillus occidentalis]|nr:hypothetical protein EDD22DRAFT_919617 [Suillus occidentalis]